MGLLSGTWAAELLSGPLAYCAGGTTKAKRDCSQVLRDGHGAVSEPVTETMVGESATLAQPNFSKWPPWPWTPLRFYLLSTGSQGPR